MYVHMTLLKRVERNLIDYTKRGGRMIVLHHGLASAKRENFEWMKFVGISIETRDHPRFPWKVLGDTTHTLVNLNPSHFITSHKIDYDQKVYFQSATDPIIKGIFPAFDLPHTEIFLNQRFTDAKEKIVLFGFRVENLKTEEIIMQATSGWYKNYGRGLLFYFQPGHTTMDFQNKNFCQILLNCIQWSQN